MDTTMYMCYKNGHKHPKFDKRLFKNINRLTPFTLKCDT